MFCTIITYLIWFCCCCSAFLPFFVLGWLGAWSANTRTEGWREKAFGKFNFIAFSWVNVWGVHQIVFAFFFRSENEKSEEPEQAASSRKNRFGTFLQRHRSSAVSTYTINVFTNLCVCHKTEIHAMHRPRRGFRAFSRSPSIAKYCIASRIELRSREGDEMNMQITREKPWKAFTLEVRRASFENF